MAQQTLSVLVENSPGVLARVASLFSRRGYNIDSLAVGPTEDPEVSRMTIVLNLEGHALDQVSAQLYKLVNVIGIQEIAEEQAHQRELLLIKVGAKAAEVKPALAGIAAEVIDEREGVCIIQAVASAKDLADMVKRLNKFGIKELVQSGSIALELGAKTLAEQTAIETGLATSESHQQTEDYQN